MLETATVLVLTSTIAFFSCRRTLTKLLPKLLAANLGGIDLNKLVPDKQGERVPESGGLACVSAFLISSVVSLSLSPHVAYSSLLAILIVSFLGFADDVLNFRWRVKFIVPSVAAAIVVHDYTGSTSMWLPFFGQIDLGVFFLVYVAVLVIFLTNSINIYAGINGLEVGQSLVIGAFLCFHDLICIAQGEAVDQHTRSLYIVVPFIAVSFALYLSNKYPSKVFVGDTYCYFAGMALAGSAVAGGSARTILVLVIPQIFNFLLSIPQLVGIVPCPRHRLPKYDHKIDKLTAVWPGHMNLINFFLNQRGPCNEGRMCNELLVLQVVCCTAGLILRHKVAFLFGE